MAQPSKTPSRLSPNQQLVRVGIASVAGMIVARILPYLYAPIVGSILNVLGIKSPARDQLNTVLMTALTFSASFAVSFVSVRGRGRKA